MKYLTLSVFFLFVLNSTAQDSDREKINVNQLEVEFVYNHYMQDGDNSAITGGAGTERLIVYGPSMQVKRSFGKNIIDFQLGADIISSASTDKIDFVVSSASRLDARTYTNMHYSRLLNNAFTLNGGIGFSIESDYFSFAKYLGVSKVSKNKMQTFSGQIQVFNDDLRWGRLNEKTNFGPSNLVYPIELRFQEWYDVHERNTYNLNLSFTQVLDKRNVVGIFGLLSYQEGLLATPFHRIYFSDDTLAVEQLPKKRKKGSLGFRWNRFIKGNLITRNSISGYADNFDITGFSIENETALKIDPKWTVYGNIRYYTQSASKYFAPYKMHDSASQYYTSDFDLSKFNSYKIGFGFKFSPYHFKTKFRRFDTFTLNYNYYRRSNNLSAHMFSLTVKNTRFYKTKK